MTMADALRTPYLLAEVPQDDVEEDHVDDVTTEEETFSDSHE